MPIMSAPASTCARANRSSISTTNSNRSRTNSGSSKKSSIRVLMPRRSARLGARALDPALDQLVSADALARKSATARTRSCMRPPPAGSGHRQPAELASCRASSASSSTMAGGWSSKKRTCAPQSAASRAGSEMQET